MQEQKISLKKDLQELQKFEKQINKFIKMGFDIDSPAIESLHKTYNYIIERMVEIYEDTYEWIIYFVYDCGFGEVPDRPVMVDDKQYFLNSIDSFIDFWEDK